LDQKTLTRATLKCNSSSIVRRTKSLLQTRDGQDRHGRLPAKDHHLMLTSTVTETNGTDTGISTMASSSIKEVKLSKFKVETNQSAMQATLESAKEERVSQPINNSRSSTLTTSQMNWIYVSKRDNYVKTQVCTMIEISILFQLSHLVDILKLLITAPVSTYL
jgi:hypothetical protein